MKPIDLVMNTITPRKLPGELVASGFLDHAAGLGLVISGVLYITFDALGGPIRGILGPIGLTPVIYLPSIVAIGSLAINTITRVGDRKTIVPTVAFFAFLLLETLISVLLGRNIKAVLFEIYIMTPAIVMMAAVQRRMQERIIRVMIPLFFVAVAGVIVNYFVRFPWADSTYEVLGQQVQATREWSYQGQNRVAGFSRISVAAAAQILLGYCVLEQRLKSLAWRVFWWAVGLVAILMTTSKSPALAMAMLPITYLIIGRVPSTTAVQRKFLAEAMLALWIVLVSIGPFISVMFRKTLYPHGIGTGQNYNSLDDRVLNTWPDAISMVNWSDPISWLVGRGLGGIGAPSEIYEAPGNTADSFSLYLVVTFGLFAVPIAYQMFVSGRRSIISGGKGRRDLIIIIALLGIGTAAGIEQVTTTLLLGLALVRPIQLTQACITTNVPRLRKKDWLVSRYRDRALLR